MPSLWRTGTRHQPSSQACPCPPIPSQFETSGLSSRVFLGRGQGYLVGSTDFVNQTFVRNIPGPPLRAPVRRTQWAPELVWPWLTFKNDLSIWKGRGLWCVVVQWENPWLSFLIIEIILKNNVFIMWLSLCAVGEPGVRWNHCSSLRCHCARISRMSWGCSY